MDGMLMTSASNKKKQTTVRKGRHSLNGRAGFLKNSCFKHHQQHNGHQYKQNRNSGQRRSRGRRDGNGNSRNVNLFCNGKFTREVYHAICGRLGHIPHIPGDSVQALFNDMHLYPSKSEVSEMLQCARQVGRRNGTSSYMTFGEFCFFAREMQKPKLSRKPQAHKSNKCSSNCEVFLGGSCNPTTWRADTAIPELQKHGITYYNPQVSMWAPELVAQEHDAKQSASLLLYVVDSQTRSVAGMIEVAYLVAAGRCVVLVACPYREGQSIMDETITTREYLDLVNGQTSLLALVKSQGIRVHSNLTSALQTTANILRNTSKNNGMTAEEQVTHKLRKLREAFDSFDTDRTGEINLTDVLDAYRRLTNRTIDARSLCAYLGADARDASSTRISFEQFCALVAEFGSSDGGCETIGHDDWISQPLQRQCATNNNVHYDNVGPNENGKVQSSNGDSSLIDVYLGGSCATGHCWREEAIKLLKKRGATYYNPAVTEIEGDTSNGESVCESLVLQRKRAMDKSSVLLFYITDDTRSMTTMILAAHYIGLDRNVVLCIQHLPQENVEIFNEQITKQAIKDYNRGRVYLQDLAMRKQVPVFESITEAVHFAVERSRSDR